MLVKVVGEVGSAEREAGVVSLLIVREGTQLPKKL